MASRLMFAKLMLLASTLTISSASFAEDSRLEAHSNQCSEIQFLPQIQKIINDRFENTAVSRVLMAYKEDGLDKPESIEVGTMKLIPVRTLRNYENIIFFLVENPKITVKSKDGVHTFFPKNRVIGTGEFASFYTVLDDVVTQSDDYFVNNSIYDQIKSSKASEVYGTLRTKYNLLGEIKSKVCEFSERSLLGSIFDKDRFYVPYFYKKSDGTFGAEPAFGVNFNLRKEIKDGKEVIGQESLLKIDITKLTNQNN